MLEWKNLTADQKDALDLWWRNNTTDYECVDNERYAIKGNAEQEADYELHRSNGCCGFCDVELEVIDGSTLLYGFNYGH